MSKNVNKPYFHMAVVILFHSAFPEAVSVAANAAYVLCCMHPDASNAPLCVHACTLMLHMLHYVSMHAH